MSAALWPLIIILSPVILLTGELVNLYVMRRVRPSASHGVSVTRTAPRRSPVVAKARELVAVARRYGLGPDELAEIIEQVSVELS
jgi:hypothetical protein